MNYLLIKTGIRIGEIENTVVHIAQSKMRIEACAAEVAQSVNHGSFDAEFYKVPCFDVDGFIAYPESIKIITEAEYSQMQRMGIDQYTLEQDESDLDECVKQFLEVA